MFVEGLINWCLSSSEDFLLNLDSAVNGSPEKVVFVVLMLCTSSLHLLRSWIRSGTMATAT